MKRKPSRFSDLVTVHTTAGLIRAQVVKAKLQAAGIPALLDYESAGPVIGITVNGIGAVRVRVPEEHAEDARALIVEE